jgi:hypothetical protein
VVISLAICVRIPGEEPAQPEDKAARAMTVAARKGLHSIFIVVLFMASASGVE